MGTQKATPGGEPGADTTQKKCNLVIHQKGGKVNPDDRKQAAQDAFARDPGPLLHALRLTTDDHQSKPPQVYFVFDGPEKNASLQVGGKPSYAGRWTRYGTDKGGDAFDLVCHVRGWNVRADFVRALEVVENAYGITPTTPPAPASSSSAAPPPVAKRPPAPLSPDALAKFVDALTARPELVSWLNDRRGFSPGLVAAARIGLDAKAGRFVLPVLDAEGNCRDLRRWRIPEAVCDEFGLTPSSSNATWLPLRPGDGSGAPRLYDPFSCVTEGGDRPLFLAEGEWDALRLADAGSAAFTVTDGAGKWPDGRHDNPPPDLTGRTVYVVGDHDPAGTRHNETGSLNCYLAGAAQVFAVQWPEGFTEKGDASDWLNSGRTVDDLQTLAVEVPEPVAPQEEGAGLGVTFRDLPAHTTAADMAERIGETQWLWPRWLPLGHLSLLAAKRGVGKSALALWLENCVATGGPWPDAEKWPDAAGSGVPGYALHLESESFQGGHADRIRQWGLKADRILFMGRDGLASVKLEDEEGLEGVRRVVAFYGVKLVVIDALRRATSADENDSRLASILAAWADLARDCNCAFLLLHHMGKGYDGTRPPTIDDLRGTSAIADVARSAIGLWTPDPTRPAVVAAVQMKASLLSAADAEACKFSFDFDPAGGLDFDVPAPEPPRDVTELDRAEELIVTTCRAQGFAKRRDLVETAATQGISRDRVDLAAKRLKQRGMITAKTLPGVKWVWCLR